MKKSFLTFTLFILFINSYSQNNNFDLGIKAGLNFTIPSISENANTNFSAKSGLNIGIFSNFRLSERVHLKPELSISTENINYKTEFYSYQEKAENKETYLNIPILLKYYLSTKINIEVGPQIGFIIKNKAKLIIDNGVNIHMHNNTYYENKVEGKFSGNIGLIYDITHDINLGIRYNIGISEINGFKNSTLSMNFGFKVL
jgi:hypothetical protein